MIIPTLEAIKALDGRIFATLIPEEYDIYKFYRDRGRKFGVSVSVMNEEDPNALAQSLSIDEAEHFFKMANSRLLVSLSAEAPALWAARATH